MNNPLTVDLPCGHPKPMGAGITRGLRFTLAGSLSGLLFPLAMLTPSVAQAVDGCLVLLCFAAPDWRAVPQCVPSIRQVLRDLARGKAFPSCGMAGAGSTAQHAWAQAPGYCPPQYTRVQETLSGPIYRCDYHGAISVAIDGAPFARTWWNLAGETVTEFSPAAKIQLGSWDTRFDDEHTAWRAALPPAAAPGH